MCGGESEGKKQRHVIDIIGHMSSSDSHLFESGPFLTMTNLSLASPPTGMRSEPVIKASSRFFCSSEYSLTICQKLLHRITGEYMRGEVQYMYVRIEAYTMTGWLGVNPS